MVLVGYLFGSIPTAVWVSKAFFGKDVRDHGSGNAGATNVFRVLGWKPALFVVLVDVAKGVVPTMMTPIWFAETGLESVMVQLIAGTAAVLGHCYTCFARFRGGKGVGTAAGMLAVLYPIALPICLLVFIVTVWRTRFVSLGSILAAVTLPVTQVVLILFFGREVSTTLLAIGILLVPFILFTHRGNIRRLVAGTENKIGRNTA